MKYSISMQENNDEYYKQIFCSNEHLNYEKDQKIKINLTNRLNLFIFSFLILTSQSNALPSPQINYNYIQQSSSLSSPSNILQSPDPSIYTYKVYRNYPIPSYSNGAVVQVSDQINFNNQQQFKRERYRRTMIDRMVKIFDEDANGQLSTDELYSLSLRLNIFPKFHHFLKKTSTKK